MTCSPKALKHVSAAGLLRRHVFDHSAPCKLRNRMSHADLMKIMDGLTCAREIRNLEKSGTIVRHVPIIAVTANARLEQIETALTAGMVSYSFHSSLIVVLIKTRTMWSPNPSACQNLYPKSTSLLHVAHRSLHLPWRQQTHHSRQGALLNNRYHSSPIIITVCAYRGQRETASHA